MSASIVVVGDAMLDVDIDTVATRLSPDGAAPVLEQELTTERAGGAALAARILAGLRPDDRVTLVTAVGDDADGRRLRELVDRGVQVVLLPTRAATSVKTRLRCGGTTLARVDRGDASSMAQIADTPIADVLRDVDAVLVADYGRGVAEVLRGHLAAITAPMVWDPHPKGALPMGNAMVVTPNATEAARFSGVDTDEPLGLCRAARELVGRWRVRAVCVTAGADGAVFADADGVRSYPAPQTAAGDCCGAGDSFAAGVTAELAHGTLLGEAVAAGVATASTFVARGGVAALDADQPRQARGDDAMTEIAAARASGATVVATGGCFDLLHAGHVATIEAARRLGDFLVVFVNSDSSVQRLKGPDRPLQPLEDRQRVLAALRSVDAVLAFDEDTPERLLRAVRPDIWVKGGDYLPDQLPEQPLIKSWGGQIVTTPYLAGRSTTDLVASARG